jgi:hypothetical protein
MSTTAQPATSTAAPAFTPEAFGKYYLVDRIAVGGMAEIFRAKTFGEGGFENTVVIKRILGHMSENEQFIQMFLDEAKVTALLQHTNIVRIWDFGKISSNYFLAMDCVDGKDVKQILRKLAERKKLLPREFAVYVALEAAKGLDFAHKKTTPAGQPLHIVHRDISPSNLLVSYSGEVKVADFGIVQASNVNETTAQGTLKGKFEYMSPEQACGKELDRRSDILSLGIILWEMLTGRRLNKTDNEMKTLERVKLATYDPPSTVNPAVPARLDEIVMRALDRDPSARYQDAREFHADLLEFLYPASPDLTQQSLAHFMAELFADDIAAERTRLAENTRLALALHEAAVSVELEPEWEEAPSAGKAVGRGRPGPPSTRGPVLAVGLAGLIAIGAAVAAVATWVATREEAPPPQAPAAPTVGVVRVTVAPGGGRVLLDGKVFGEGPEVVLPAVSPDASHTLRVEKDGFTAFEEKISVQAGETLRMPVTLQAVVKAPEPRPDRSEPRAPRPEAPPSATSSVSPPSPPPAEPRKEEVATGKVSINVSGGWAEISIDGKKVGNTPIFNKALPAGAHQVRARNDQIGLDETRSVTVKAGETATVMFTAG